MPSTLSPARHAVPDPVVASKIYFIRGHRVMIDADLAALYRVETKQLKRAVKRNITRFPSDFMFKLKAVEVRRLRYQFGTSSWGGSRYTPMAFTEQGVAMLSSILSSPRAIKVNIHIIRVFTQLREVLLTHKDLLLKLERLEKRVTGNESDIRSILDHIQQLISYRSEPPKRIGFKRQDEL